MLRRLRTRFQEEEEGIALITALLVSMVVITLGATAVTLSIHNSEASSFDRRRVESVAAAEAGVNFYFSHLQSVAREDFQCSISRDLTGTPTTHFTATVTFYSAAGTALPCPPATTEPKAALIRSVGTSTSDTPARTMEAFVNLIPLRGAPFGDYAVFSDSDPRFASNSQVFGGTSSSGNIYSNGNIRIESNSIIYGDVNAQGSIQLDSNAEVKKSLWAGTNVLAETSARVLGNIRAATGTVTLRSSTHVYGDVRAGTTITTNGATVDGRLIPNSPSSKPPTLTFPGFTYTEQSWIEDGYTPQTFTTCASAKSFLNALPTGKWVVRITAVCDLTWGPGTGPTVRGDLAIVSEGSLTMGSNSGIFSDGGAHTLRLIFGLANSLGTCNITFNQNSIIAAGLKTLMYTPCQLNLSSNSLVIEGQVFAGSVSFNSNAHVTYLPIPVPGVGAPTFDEDIVYMREVITGS